MTSTKLHDSSYDTAIAIIGMSGRFPGASTIEDFWHNIANGVKSIRKFTDEELRVAGVDPALLALPNYVKAGTAIDEVDRFDASFFGYTPREAEIMDPQHRLFLECCWEALENAAYDVRTYRGLVGVFAGSAFSTYLLHNLYPNKELLELIGQLQVDVGNDRDSLASTVSYKLNLKGPSVAVQTFCSTSLVAIHLACQSLLNYDCDIVLAGGVAILIPQETGYLYEEGGILSPDGACHTFDASGKGSVMGNGLGVVALKRFTEALEDGDHIYAVIRGSAINNDGSTRVSYTAPGLDGQASVISGALSYAGIDAESIGYIEAHGTATMLGDAVELAAMMKAFSAKTQETQFCAIGSVKPNIGHLDRAAGVAGLIKAALALQHKQLPPSLNFERTSSDINLENSPFYVNTRLQAWQTRRNIRRAGVSSFGLGGTNAHVVLEEAPLPEPSSPSRPCQLLVLSAKTDTALKTMTSRFVEHLQTNPDLNLADVAHTLRIGRSAFSHRQVLVCRDRLDAINALTIADPARAFSVYQERAYQVHRDRPVAFLFPGLGEQYASQAQELYQHEAIFRETVDRCCTFLSNQLQLDLHDLFSPTQALQANVRQMPTAGIDLRRGDEISMPVLTADTRTELAQPAIFIMEYALAQLLQQWGIHPQALLGYSLGEYVAACLSGVLSLEDALTLVARRAQLIVSQPEGAMLAVFLPQEQVQPYLTDQVCLAAINAPSTCVLAGPLAPIKQIAEHFNELGIVSRFVPTQHAFHSQMLEPVREALIELTRNVKLHAPQIPYISNVTGTWITAEQATDPTYWAEHMCQTVQFAHGVEHLLQDNDRLLLEVGPGQALGSFVKQHTACQREQVSLILSTAPSVHEPQTYQAFLLSTLGKLWLAGVTVDWAGFTQHERRQRLPLPTYPFERQRYWIEPIATGANHAHGPSIQQGKKADIANWFYVPSWQPASLDVDVDVDVDVDDTHRQKHTQLSPWLIFLDKVGLGEQLARRLSQEGHTVVCVQPGEQFAQQEDLRFSLRPEQSEDYVKLWEALAAWSQLPGTIVHCWSITPAISSPSTIAAFQHAQQTGFYSLLHITQALTSYQSNQSVQVIVLSSHMQAIQDAERLQPEKATVLGVCKVISQENNTILCRSIDIATEELNDELIEQLSTELMTATTERIIAYRQQQRWTQTYQARRLESAQVNASSTHPFRQHGVYLITGGLGGVGFVLAEYLVRTAQARLVLVGRSPLPTRDTWQDWLQQHADNDPISRKIAKLQELEALGAEVLTCSVDVADVGQMHALVEQVYEQFGALHGVIHAAGISDESAFGLAQNIGARESEQHFQPKVYGTYALEQALQDKTLDFCILFSSLSAVLGGLGFAAYTAANLFLDAFAQKHNQDATFSWISVNWDTWQVKEGAVTTLGRTVAEYAMTPTEGIEAFTRILATHGLTHIINSTGDLEARIRQWIMLEALQDSDITDTPELAEQQSSSARIRPPLFDLTTNEDYERKLTEIWQRVLGTREIGLYDNFFELGGNSLNGLQVVSRIRKVFHVQVPVVALFEAPTISAMVKYLHPEPQPVEKTRQHLLEQRRTQARQAVNQQDIALIGMTGRFPGAAHITEFWNNLRNGVESVTFFTDEELLAAGIPPEELHHPNYVRARPILADVEHFDAAFFGYSPREAELMDPQHRLFMECAWEALEKAGYDPFTYTGLIGIFGGANVSTYLHRLLLHREQVEAQLGTVSGYQIAVGTDKDSLTTGVSYKFNLRGPSLAVQTFCSTSLVAVHLACQNLLNGECDLALAGGVSIRIPVKGGHIYQEGGMESPDGHCRTFDAQAKGGMFGDGVGVVVLKRLVDALEDGDTIHAVIKGSAINNDGSLKVSYTAPSVAGQAQVVTTALQQAGINAESISYIEAHGTATELGDPIEVASLTRAFRSQTDQTGYCAIGSVKTNIGHLDRAAGVSGLIKTVLALKHSEIPPSLHFESPNPEIDFEHSPFYVNTKLSPWPRNGRPRRAGINSLGMGGTNAHVIVEEAPPAQPSGPSRSSQLLLLSARTATALEQATENLRQHLQEHSEENLADVAYTLQVGRSVFNHRRFLVCSNHEDAIHSLAKEIPGRLLTTCESARDRSVAFLFPGLGEQYIEPAQELYQHEITFRKTVDHCCAILLNQLQLDLRGLFTTQTHSSTGQTAPASFDLKALLKRGDDISTPWFTTVERTEQVQPAIFIVEYALAQVLLQWGIRPQAMLGYSLGEYVAACLASVLSLEDALMLVTQRARLIATQPRGAMLAVSLPQERVQPYLNEQINLAVINAPGTCVLSGPMEAIEQLAEQFNEQGIVSRHVQVMHAFHSSMLRPVYTTMLELARNVKWHAPQIPYISNVTGTWITAEQATDPTYWAEHMCQTVQFAQGVEHLLQEPERILLEVGPGQALSSFVKQHTACQREQFALILPSLVTQASQTFHAGLLSALGKLWLAGITVDWEGFFQHERRHRLPLPTYPFERQRYWIDLKPQERAVSPSIATSDGILPRLVNLSDWFYLPSWKQSLQTSSASIDLTTQHRWLMFLDNCEIGTQLVQRLLQCEQNVVAVVTAGSRFSRQSENMYTVQPGDRASYDLLLKDLHSRSILPTDIAHLWMVTPTTERVPGPETLEEMLEHGFYSLLALVQTLGEWEGMPFTITVISNELQDITGNEQLRPEKATLIGPCRVIPQEYANISCRSIDITLPRPGSGQEKLIDLLLCELNSPITDTVVALRGKNRWTQTFEPVTLAPAAPPSPLRPQGVYLITGGLGGIGLAMAEHLARTVQAKVVLLSRSGFPERQEWHTLLHTCGESEGIGCQIRAMLRIEELGGEVLVLQADVSSQAQMQRALRQTLNTFGTLHGVLHAAGVPGVGLIQLKTADMARKVLTPKVMGTLVLTQALRELSLSLDFLVLFSSMTSLTGGGPGQVDYCAANAFLDAYAHHCQDQHGMTIAIDWGEWQWNAWEVGLSGYGAEAQNFFKENRQRIGISFEEGAETLSRILAQQLPHVVVSTQEFRQVAALSKTFTAAMVLQRTREVRQDKAIHPRPSLGSSYIAPGKDLERQITAVWEDLLGISPVGINDNFFELGGNSLIGLDLIARLKKALHTDVLATHVLYEAPSVSALARYIEQSTQDTSIEGRRERGAKRRESLKQRTREIGRTL